MMDLSDPRHGFDLDQDETFDDKVHSLSGDLPVFVTVTHISRR